MKNQSKAEEFIRSIIAERLAGVEIAEIDIHPDVGEDDDDILVINVVFRGDRKALDPRKTVGIVRHLLPRIWEEGAKGFPILSFISESDRRRMSADTA